MKQGLTAIYGAFAAATLLAACGTGKPVSVSLASSAASDTTGQTTGSENSAATGKSDENSTPKPEGTGATTTSSAIHPADTSQTTTEPAPPNLRLAEISIPSSATAGQTLSVALTIINSGGPANGVFGVARIQAQVLFIKVDESRNIDSKETIPSGQSTKTFSVTIPAAARGVKGNVCITGYADAQHTTAISETVCRNIQIN